MMRLESLDTLAANVFRLALPLASDIETTLNADMLCMRRCYS